MTIFDFGDTDGGLQWLAPDVVPTQAIPAEPLPGPDVSVLPLVGPEISWRDAE